MSSKEVKSATALHYNPELDEAPRVVAAGRGELADRIIRAAREAGIPIHQDSDLADLLANLELGTEIPPELYQVIAEVLAFIYRLDSSQGTD